MQGTRTRRKPFEREIDDDLEALRDDCIALFLNSRLTQKDIHAAGGPTPGTISKWLYKETLFPRYQTIASFTRALGCRLVVVDKAAAVPGDIRQKVASATKKRMPIRAKKKGKP